MSSSGAREGKSVMILPRAKVGGHPRRVQESPESNPRREFKVDTRRLFQSIDRHNCGDPLSLRRIGIQNSPQPRSVCMHVDFTRPMIGTWRRPCCDTQQDWWSHTRRRRECALTLHRKSSELDVCDSLRMIERKVGNARRREEMVARLRRRVVLVGLDQQQSEMSAKQRDETAQGTGSAKWHRLHSGSRSTSSLLRPSTTQGCESSKTSTVVVVTPHERKMRSASQRPASHATQNQALQSHSQQGAPDLQQKENAAVQGLPAAREREGVCQLTRACDSTTHIQQRGSGSDSLCAVLSDLNFVDHRLRAYKSLMGNEIDQACIRNFATLDSLYAYKARQRSEKRPHKVAL